MTLPPVGDYIAVPLHFEQGISNLRAIAQKDINTLLFTLESSEVFIRPVQIGANSAEIAKSGSKISFPNMDSLPVNIKVVEGRVFIHFRNELTKRGTLLNYGESKVPQVLGCNVDHFAISEKSTKPVNMIAVADNSNLIVFEFKEVGYEEKFRKNLNGKILTLCFCNPYVVAATNTTLIEIDISNGKTSDVVSSYADPYLMVRDRQSWILYNQMSSTILKTGLLTNQPPIMFSTKAIDHTRATPVVFSLTSDRVVAYDFTRTESSTRILDGTKIFCFEAGNNATIDHHILVASKHDIFILRNVRDAFGHFVKDDLAAALKYLPKNDPDTLMAFFEYTWNFKDSHGRPVYRERTLKYLSYSQFFSFIVDILKLFDICVLDIEDMYEQEPNFGQTLVNAEHTLDHEITQSLVSMIRKNIRQYNNLTIEYCNAAIAQFYSNQGMLNELSEFFEFDMLIHHQSMSMYFEKNSQSEGFPIYEWCFEREHKAMEAFLSLSNPSANIKQLIFSYLSSQKNAWEFVSPFAQQLIDKFPIDTCQLFVQPNFDLTQVHKFINQNAPHYYTKFLLLLIQSSKDFSNHYANEACKRLLELMVSASSPSFNRNQAMFLECVIKNKDAPMKEIKDELSLLTIKLLNDYPQFIQAQQLTHYVPQIDHPKLKEAIYQAEGKTEEAILIRWNSAQTKKLESCSEFCRGTQNPEFSFGIMIRIMKDHLPTNEFIPSLIRLVQDNIEYVDIDMAFDSLPQDIAIDSIFGELQTLYRNTIDLNNQEQFFMQQAKSDEFESRYQLAFEKSKHISIQDNTTCAGCGKAIGFQYIHRKPNGRLYHLKCLK